MKVENRDLLADSHNILNRWKNYFSQLLNVHNFSDIRQIEVNTIEPGPSHLEVAIAIANLKGRNCHVVNKFHQNVIKVRGEILLSAIHKLINTLWNKEELPDQWKESIIVPIHKKCNKTDCNNYRVVRVLDYRSRGPGFDSRALQKQ
jgi:hypothetical protein